MILLFSSLGLYLITEKNSSSYLLIMFLLINIVMTCISVIASVTCYSLDVSSFMINSDFHVLLIMIAVLQGMFCIGYIIYANVLFRKYGWNKYKTQGADKEALVIAETYDMFTALVKFGLLIFTCYFLVYIASVDHRVVNDWYSALLFLFVLIFMGAISIYGVKLESRVISFNYFLMLVLLMIYIIFGLKKYYSSSLNVGDFKFNQALFTFFAITAIITILAKQLSLFLCFRYFGKGLRAVILTRGKQRQDKKLKEAWSAAKINK